MKSIKFPYGSVNHEFPCSCRRKIGKLFPFSTEYVQCRCGSYYELLAVEGLCLGGDF